MDNLETILLVEDEPAVRSLFAQTLRRAGYRVVEARHAPDALEVFDAQGGNVDLLLTDIMMPFMKGSELAEQLLARRPNLKRLYVSGHLLPGDLGPNCAVLTKPFLPHQLLRKVRDVLDDTD